jgi:hypothetical protein
MLNNQAQLQSKSLHQLQSDLLGNQLSYFSGLQDSNQQIGTTMNPDSPPIKFLNLVDNEQPLYRVVPSAAAAQPITKIFNPVQSSLMGQYGLDELYPVQNPYGYSTHLGN